MTAATATAEAFEERVAAMDEVIELRRVIGLPRLLIRVRVGETSAYENWLTTHLLGVGSHRLKAT
jgi:DNA-binding Lrp family transcriptional regulator